MTGNVYLRYINNEYSHTHTYTHDYHKQNHHK